MRDLPKINLVYNYDFFFVMLTGVVNVFEIKSKMFTRMGKEETFFFLSDECRVSAVLENRE